MKKIILLAIVTYLLIAPFSYHPDTKLTLRYPSLENGSVWDIYEYVNEHNLNMPDFHYPPAHYWWLKIHYPISRFIGGDGFDNWLGSASAQASLDVNALKFNAATKLPLLSLGILCGWLIYKIVCKVTKNDKIGSLAAMFWYFNPITIYSLVMMGQNDVVAIFLFLSGMLLCEKWWLAIPLWGLASGVKNYPLIWAIIFILVWEKNIIKVFIRVCFLAIIFGTILLPWLGKDYFIQSVFNSGLSQRMFTANIPIGFNKQILIVPLLLTIVALNAWKNKSDNRLINASYAIFQSCLVILGFSHFNPQWMLWTIPFLSIWIFTSDVKNKEVLPLLTIFFAWFLLILGFDDRFLTWGLLTPINPGLINFPSLVAFIKNKGGDISSLINLAQTLLAGVGVWYLSKRTLSKSAKKIKLEVSKWFIFMPWLIVGFVVFLFTNIKTDNVLYSQISDTEISLGEIIDKEWKYDVLPNLRYFEISLNNLGLNSQDEGILIVNNDKGDVFEKKFSGFNAGANSWLRVDVPELMSNSKSLTLTSKEIDIKDGLLKIRLDDNNKWAVNFYNENKPSISDLVKKLLAFWWWWLILFGISWVYFKTNENQDNN